MSLSAGEAREPREDLDPLGATFLATGGLVDAVDGLRHEADGTGRHLVLLAGSVSNGSEITDAHGTAALEAVTRRVVGRAVQADLDGVRLLRLSPLGSFLAALLVDGSDPLTAAVTRLTDPLRGFVTLDAGRVWPVVSVGLRACGPGEDVVAAVREARTTLLAAGHEAPGSVRWHQATAPAPERFGDLELVRDLAEALTEHREQLSLVYQPVFDLRSGTLISAEALIRWTHPERGVVSPLVAVTAAERSGLIHLLGRFVLERALEQTALWLGHVGPTFRVHVNVSALELQDPTYVEAVAAALGRSGVPPHMLLLEITETALLSEDHAVLQALYRLRALGIGLGIDDFGTGYSSIAHLHRLPVDTVKVDRSLVTGIATSPADFSLIRTVLGLLATTQVTVIAEGIEDAVQSAHLQAVGAIFGQGYHLGRPMTPEVFLPTVVATEGHGHVDESATA